MGKLLRILPLIFIFTGALFLFERPAYAYTDPGTGLLAIQAVGSVLMAGGWYLRKKIHSFFRREPAAEPAPQTYASVKDTEGTTQL